MRAGISKKNMAMTGIPFILVVVGGSFFLSKFSSTQFEIRDQLSKSVSTRKFDLEEEHKKIMRELDIDNYKLSRIARPDESLPAKKETNKQE
mmetsp:Transcript_1563/g.2503  ORF Transcript_1563/g.2503 Transcript_1563/m.2503 type:complete len:92 (+) Transcript_1563:87-362(+)